MRALPSVFALAIAVPLGGCSGLTAPKPIPDWAMNSHIDNEAPRARMVRQTAARQVADDSSMVMPTASGNAVMTTGAVTPPVATLPSGPTAYSPEWHAEEKAADDRLRRQMNICSGC